MFDHFEDNEFKEYWNSVTTVTAHDMSSADEYAHQVAAAIIDGVIARNKGNIAIIEATVRGHDDIDIPFLMTDHAGSPGVCINNRFFAIGEWYNTDYGDDVRSSINYLAGLINRTQLDYYKKCVATTFIEARFFDEEDKSEIDSFAWKINNGKVSALAQNPFGQECRAGWMVRDAHPRVLQDPLCDEDKQEMITHLFAGWAKALTSMGSQSTLTIDIRNHDGSIIDIHTLRARTQYMKATADDEAKMIHLLHDLLEERRVYTEYPDIHVYISLALYNKFDAYLEIPQEIYTWRIHQDRIVPDTRDEGTVSKPGWLIDPSYIRELESHFHMPETL